MEKKIIEKLLKYRTSGAYFLIYRFLLLHSEGGDMNITQKELAKRLRMSREGVLNALKVLVKEDLIKHRYGKITIVNN